MLRSALALGMPRQRARHIESFGPIAGAGDLSDGGVVGRWRALLVRPELLDWEKCSGWTEKSPL
jgi:hypothetical protein